MNEKTIVERVVNVLSEIENLQTQSAMDFTEKRMDNMCVVGITSTTQLNEGAQVPDYEYRMQILIDCSIPEDDSGDEFFALCSEVKMRLLQFELNNSQLQTLFGNLPIVYFQFIDQAFSTSEHSNICTLNYRIIGSY